MSAAIQQAVTRHNEPGQRTIPLPRLRVFANPVGRPGRVGPYTGLDDGLLLTCPARRCSHGGPARRLPGALRVDTNPREHKVLVTCCRSRSFLDQDGENARAGHIRARPALACHLIGQEIVLTPIGP